MKIIIIKRKNELHDTITSIDNFDAVLEYDPATKTFKLVVSGSFKDGGNMPKSGLTEADWDRITNLIFTAVKPIQEDIKVLKEDMTEVKTRLKAIEECPTIKKELKK